MFAHKCKTVMTAADGGGMYVIGEPTQEMAGGEVGKLGSRQLTKIDDELEWTMAAMRVMDGEFTWYSIPHSFGVSLEDQFSYICYANI